MYKILKQFLVDTTISNYSGVQCNNNRKKARLFPRILLLQHTLFYIQQMPFRIIHTHSSSSSPMRNKQIWVAAKINMHTNTHYKINTQFKCFLFSFIKSGRCFQNKTTTSSWPLQSRCRCG